MSEMLDKIKDILEKHNIDTSTLDDEEREVSDEVKNAVGPLEEALYRALYSLEEIRLYASYGRSQECVREATECRDKLTALRDKWIEQTQIMDALTAPVENNTGGYS